MEEVCRQLGWCRRDGDGLREEECPAVLGRGVLYRIHIIKGIVQVGLCTSVCIPPPTSHFNDAVSILWLPRTGFTRYSLTRPVEWTCRVDLDADRLGDVLDVEMVGRVLHSVEEGASAV